MGRIISGSLSGRTPCFGEYPPKNPEAEIKPVNESGEIVLSKVVIPEYIVVHDGPAGDTSAGIITYVTKIISKMWPAARSMRPGRTIRFVPMCGYIKATHTYFRWIFG